MVITPLDIEAIRKRAEAATPGPWKTHLVDDTSIVTEDGTDVCTTCDSSQAEREDGYNVEYERMEADAAFIAHARTDIPALLSHIAALDAAHKVAAATLRQLRTDLTAANEKLAVFESRDSDHLDEIERLRAEDLRQTGELTAANEKLASAREVIEQQANDEGLWFFARTAPEAYLQAALRNLHAAVEGTDALGNATHPTTLASHEGQND